MNIYMKSYHHDYISQFFLHYFVHRYADKIVLGNDILVGENNKMTPAKVIRISNVKANGKY